MRMILFARAPKTKSPLHKYLLKDLHKLFLNSSILENKISYKNIKEISDMHECETIFYLKKQELIISGSINQSEEENNVLLKFKLLKIETIEHLKIPYNCTSEGQYLLFTHNVNENIKKVFSNIINAHNLINKENGLDKILSLINIDNLLYLRIYNSEGNEIGPRVLLEMIV